MVLLEGVHWKIYLNHTLSSWGDRMWTFAVGLYLLILYPNSLILPAILGFSMCLTVIVFGSYLGKWIDRTPRMTVAMAGLFFEDFFVIIGSVLLALNLSFQSEIEGIWGGYLQWGLYAAIIISTIISHLGSFISDIAIERDWIVVLSGGNDKKLASLNSTMRSIDLSTHILAPLVMGQIITFGSPLAGTIFLGSWNLISALIEWKLLTSIYSSVPQLAKKDFGKTTETPEFKNGWKIYFTHEIRFAGIAFALLFMTAMGFDSITLGYMYSQGVSESLIGIVVAVGAIFGILASLTFPYLRSNIGNTSTGNIGFGLNVLFLLFCVGSVFAPGSPFDPLAILSPFATSGEQPIGGKSLGDLWKQNLNIFYFIFGIILGRFGLWLADLSVTQIIQEGVEESQRGVVNGVQNSLNQFMNLLKFFLIICLPSVEAFGYIIIFSWIFMLFAWIFFIIFSCGGGALSRYSSMESLEWKPLLKKDASEGNIVKVKYMEDHM